MRESHQIGTELWVTLDENDLFPWERFLKFIYVMAGTLEFQMLKHIKSDSGLPSVSTVAKCLVVYYTAG